MSLLSKLELTQIAMNSKRANQRLREMEKQGVTDLSRPYQQIVGMFYLQDIVEGTDIFSRTKSGQIKFRTDISRMMKESPEKVQLLKERLESFLKTETSTVKGLKEQEKTIKHIQDVVRDRYGQTLSRRQVTAMMSDSALKNKLMEYTSYNNTSIVLNDIEEGKLNRDDVVKYLDEVEAGQQGWSLGDLYAYNSNTADKDWIEIGDDWYQLL